MIYKIAPYANPNEGLPYVTWSEAFTKGDLDLIEIIGDSLPFNNAGVVDGVDKVRTDNSLRNSITSWIPNNKDTNWLYEKISFYLRRINGEYYRFDVDGMYEQLQYTVYESEKSAFYNWHQDIGVYSTLSVTRKLSMSILLTDPTTFEGGDLEIWGSSGIMPAPREYGQIIVFPSYLLHRVTPVTKGIRKSLVIWFGGPAFR